MMFILCIGRFRVLWSSFSIWAMSRNGVQMGRLVMDLDGKGIKLRSYRLRLHGRA